jgi:hypothetical protein
VPLFATTYEKEIRGNGERNGQKWGEDFHLTFGGATAREKKLDKRGKRAYVVCSGKKREPSRRRLGAGYTPLQ